MSKTFTLKEARGVKELSAGKHSRPTRCACARRRSCGPGETGGGELLSQPEERCRAADSLSGLGLCCSLDSVDAGLMVLPLARLLKLYLH